MSEAKCPRCRGELSGATHSQHCGCETIVAKCHSCGWGSPWDEVGHDGANYDATESFVLSSCEPLAYFDPRPRLPTPEQEAAHRARHGQGAGWMVDSGQSHGPASWGPDKIKAARKSGERVRCWPHVDGRPVAGPEGW